MKQISFLFAMILVGTGFAQPSDKYKPIVLDSTYEHNKWGIKGDLVFEFAAYTTSFDSNDDDNGDGQSDIWGVPEWVAFEIKAKTDGDKPSYKRPKWMTHDSLHQLNVVPADESYHIAGTKRLPEVKSNARFARGHLCPKNAADRVSAAAGYNTHTFLNAVPQLQWQNNGIWKKLEAACENWADIHGQIWVITGPVFFKKTPSLWLGQDDEVRTAVPDALYKIVIKKSRSRSEVDVLGFIIPNIIPSNYKDFSQYLTSIDRIEEQTGLDFLTELSESTQEKVERLNLDLSKEDQESVIDSWD